MRKLKLYRVNINYIKYLYYFDKRIQYNPYDMDSHSERRPYLGIVLHINNFNYFVPLEHPIEDHKKLKNNDFILKIHNGKYGILGFNNMIPIPDNQLINFDINKQSEKYRQVLISQYRYCNKHTNQILIKANNTYINRKEGKNKFINKICCNFKLLEFKCKEFIQNN